MCRPAALLACVLLLGFAPRTSRAEPEAATALRQAIVHYTADEESLRRRYDEPLSAFRLGRLRTFLADWEDRLAGLAGADLPLQAAIDLALLENHVARRRDELRLQEARNEETLRVLPFAPDLLALEAERRRGVPLDPRAAARSLADLEERARAARRRVAAGRAKDAPEDALRVGPPLALRAARALDRMRRALKQWYAFRDGFEPDFGWWVRAPYRKLRATLTDMARWLRRTVAGVKDEHDAPLIGDPIGDEALRRALRREMVDLAPEELLALAEREFAWCEAAGRRAARELGRKDWAAAVEHVKGRHRPPGGQDDLVTAQAREAIAFLEARDLLTIPPLAAETWHVEMIDEKRQKTLPFAVYSGQRMLVAYATEGMPHHHKLQAMRGNNEHFTRIVTPHELIPGHHLQLFMAKRHRPYRSVFRTPFFVEGWALHWEMLLWDLGWHRGPADRIGMLFWRMHRCARILVTLRFHRGEMTPGEMVDFLVQRVGLEREGATSEVRRYIAGAYGPLYQAAYMTGGLQLRALHHELVGGGRLSNRAFHDAVLRQGSIPVKMVRAALTGRAPDDAPWRFQDHLPPAAEPGADATEEAAVEQGEGRAARIVREAGVRVIAHRGASAAAPENTLPAFRQAVDAGADLVELDVRTSRDGAFVAFHDESLERTTDVQATDAAPAPALADRTAAELGALDAGAWFAPRFAGTRIPRLEEALAAIHPGAVPLVERKTGEADALLDVLAARDLVPHVVIQAFDRDFLAACRARAPQAVLGALGSKRLAADDEERLASIGVAVVGWKHRDIDADLVARIHGRGWKLWAWTVNDPQRARALADLGVDGIITDRPAAVRAALAGR